MLEIADAWSLVRSTARSLPALTIPCPEALGCVLAEEIVSDVDSPPHDKSIVDGFAVRAADCANHEVELRIVEEVVAGQTPRRALAPGETTRIMTGAPVPQGADAVVMVERTDLIVPSDIPRVMIRERLIVAGQNIVRRATSIAAGQPVLRPGHELRAIELGLLAEVGRSQARVVPRPRVAVLPTGDEIVGVDQKPPPGSVRNSNGPMLTALAIAAGADAHELPVAPDDATELRELCDEGLQSDVLLLSGGVSMGIRDLVPAALADLKVRQVFHKVNLRPGKPLWFGVRDPEPGDNEERPTLVFGLPGNPVSGLVCFTLFVRPALALLSGRDVAGPRREPATLAQDFAYPGGRATYHPTALQIDGNGALVAVPLPYGGSGDLRALAGAQALAFFSGDARVFRAGETVEIVRL